MEKSPRAPGVRDSVLLLEIKRSSDATLSRLPNPEEGQKSPQSERRAQWILTRPCLL